MNFDFIGNLVRATQQCDPRSLGRDTFTYLDISSVDRFSKQIVAPQILSVQEAPSRARKLISTNDVLLSSVRPNLNTVAFVPRRFDGEIASTGFCVLRANDKAINPLYLFYYTQTETFVSHLTRLATGAGYPAVSDSDVFESEIPLPSKLTEQKRIASILEKADRLRRTRRFAQQLSDTFLQTVFVEMFGNAVTNPQRWQTDLLGNLGNGEDAIVDGPFGSSVDTSIDYISDGEVPVIRTKNVRTFEFITDDLKFMSREKFDLVRRSRVIPGDIILTKVGTIGNVCIFPPIYEEAVLSTTGSCKITPNINKINTIYLAHFLHSLKPHMNKIASEGVQPFLNMKTIKEFIISIPPKKLQQEFADIAQRFERLRAQQREATRQTDHIFQTLLHRAFRGEL